MRLLKVGEAKLQDLRLRVVDTVEKAVSLMEENGLMGLPVTDGNDDFVGVVFLKDLIKAKLDEIAANYVVRGLPYVRPESWTPGK